jgi:hypothetical protein
MVLGFCRISHPLPSTATQPSHSPRPRFCNSSCRELKVGSVFVLSSDNILLRFTVGTPKYLANQMKSKGLQRLRWYCQVCQKQCRDDNGFKCHIQSEAHLRQMLVVGENAGRHIADFSGQFQHDFVQLLSRRCAHPLSYTTLLFLIPSTDSARSASRQIPYTKSTFRTNTTNT